MGGGNASTSLTGLRAYIAGSYYINRADTHLNGAGLGALLVLCPEPANKWDKNAIRVELYQNSKWIHVGYVQRNLAALVTRIAEGVMFAGTLVMARESTGRLVHEIEITGAVENKEEAIKLWKDGKE